MGTTFGRSRTALGLIARTLAFVWLVAISAGCQSMIGGGTRGFEVRFVNAENGEPVAGVAVLVVAECRGWLGGGISCFANSFRSDLDGRVKVPRRYVPPSAIRMGYFLSRERIFAFKAGGWSLGRTIDRIWRTEQWFPHDRISGPADALVVRLVPIPANNKERRWAEFAALGSGWIGGIPRETWEDYYNETRLEAEMLEGVMR